TSVASSRAISAGAPCSSGWGPSGGGGGKPRAGPGPAGGGSCPPAPRGGAPGGGGGRPPVGRRRGGGEGDAHPAPRARAPGGAGGVRAGNERAGRDLGRNQRRIGPGVAPLVGGQHRDRGGAPRVRRGPASRLTPGNAAAPVPCFHRTGRSLHPARGR